MKKFLAILSLIFLIGCSSYKNLTIFQKEYPGSAYEYLVSDVYQNIEFYEFDSIPFSEWMQFQSYTKDDYIIEKLYQKKYNDTTEFLFSVETYVEKSFKYKFTVIMRTREKDKL